MTTHRNAKLGLAGRCALVQARLAGFGVREAARRFSVSPATVCRWHGRWQRASDEERRTLACLCDRSSRPRRMPRLLSSPEQVRICRARRRTGWGPRLLMVAVGHPHSTISKVLKRHGLSRPKQAPREPARRYEWPCPGDLLHADWTVRSLPAAGARGYRRPQLDRGREASEGRLRLRARGRRRPLAARLRRAAPRLPCCHRDRLPRAGAGRLRQPGDRGRAADDGQPLELHAQPFPARASCRARDPSPDDSYAAPAGQRQGRALPPDDGPRVGLRRPLPVLSTPRRRAATLAALLQRAQAARLLRRATADQPCSQRLWAGHLVGGLVGTRDAARSFPAREGLRSCPPATSV
jgi:transposase